jgi:hypothetical protein
MCVVVRKGWGLWRSLMLELTVWFGGVDEGSLAGERRLLWWGALV